MNVLNKISEELLRFFLSLKEDDWIKWEAQENEYYDNCDKYNGCYFIVKQMPKYPQHPFCQCKLDKIAKPIPNITSEANADIRKFTDYVFSEKYDDGKKTLFENWGYNIGDSVYLQQLFVSQALQKYCDGDYCFKGTGQFNANIQITIELPTDSGKMQKIKTGWAVYPGGVIKLLTPFTGFVK